MASDDSPEQSANKVTALAIAVILVSITLQGLLVHIERALHRYQHLSLMLNHLYRELMILGILSFILFLIESSAVHLEKDDKHLFEVVHMTIFLVVVGYIIISFSLMGLSVYLSRIWYDLEKDDLQEYISIKTQFDLLEKQRKSYPAWRWYLNLPKVLEHQRLSDQIAFHHMRLHFLHSNHLDSDFSFASYLRKCQQHVFLRLGTIHRNVWICLIIVLFFDDFQRNVYVRVQSKEHIKRYLKLFFIGIAVLLSLTSLSLFAKLRLILRKVLSSDLIDFDPIAAHYYYEHWNDDESVSCNERKRNRQAALSESANAINKMVRLYKVSSWGGKPQVKEESFPQIRLRRDSSLMIPEMEKCVKLQSMLETNPFEVEQQNNLSKDQMGLFWFASHTFVLKIMQVLVFGLVVYVAVLLQFSYIFFTPSNGVDVFLIILLIFPLPLLFVLLPKTLSLYTIVIHIGQLVDIDVVLEALKKGYGKVRIEESAVKLRREKTFDTLPFMQRAKYFLTSFVHGEMFSNIVVWFVSLDLLVLAMIFVQDVENSIGTELRMILLVNSLLFLMEVALKLILRPKRSTAESNLWNFLDVSIVVLNFVFAVLKVAIGFNGLFQIIIAFRYVTASQFTKAHRIIVEEVEQKLVDHLDHLAAKLEGSQIESKTSPL